MTDPAWWFNHVRREPGPSITCPVCGMTSQNPEDIRQGYCGARTCHDWTQDPRGHYAVRVTDLPPTEIVCKCGATFTTATVPDTIAAIKAHMEESNP